MAIFLLLLDVYRSPSEDKHSQEGQLSAATVGAASACICSQSAKRCRKQLHETVPSQSGVSCSLDLVEPTHRPCGFQAVLGALMLTSAPLGHSDYLKSLREDFRYAKSHAGQLGISCSASCVPGDEYTFRSVSINLPCGFAHDYTEAKSGQCLPELRKGALRGAHA